MPEPTPPQTPWNPLDSLRAAYLSLEEKYYQFAEYLEAHHIPFAKVFLEPIETRGIPSFPIALALLFLLLLSVFWIGAGPLLSTQASVKITVLSDQGRLDGALVTLEGPGVNRTGTTEKGSVEFANLPKGKKVTVRVAKAGYRESEQFLVIGQKNSISFSLQTNDVSIAVLVQDFQKRPLPQATLDYSYVDASGRQVSKSASSDYEGRALLNAELGVQVDGTASLSGYESKPFSFTADEGLQKTVFLRLIPQDTTVPLPSDPSEKASLSVTTKDSTGDAVESHIEVRDPDTNSLLAESDTTFGTATFNSLTVGSTVKVSADADGFDRGYTTVTLSKAKSVTLTLKAASGNGIRSTIKIVDDKGKPLKAYAAFIEIGPGDGNYSVFKESSEVSELTTTLASGRYYYGVAYKNGFLPSKSLRFAAGETKTIALIPATVSNSANLTVSVKDEDGLKITDAVALGFYDSDGEWIPPFNLKVLSGSTRFVGLPKATLTVKASYKSLKGAQSVSLQTGSGEANLTLFYPRATLRVLPVDFQSGANLSNFNATVNFSGNFRNNSQLASCAPAAGAVYCDLDVRADKNAILSVVAPLYQRANVSLTANLLKVGNVSEQSVRLVSLTDTGIVYVSNDIRFYDSENNLVTQLTADRSYWVKFFVYFAEGASQGGVFLRFNSFAPYDEVAFIVNTSQETPFAINGSSVVRGNGNFSGNLSPSLCALDFNGGARYQLAFADFQYNFTGSREVAFAVKVRADVGNATNVSMNYRAYAVANGKYYRTPVDTLMGNQNETATRPWCTAATLTKNFPLIACGGFGQVCCTTRGAPDHACDFGYQCMPNGASAPNTCQFPTACGQSTRFCSDNTVCCLDGGSKSCKPSSGTGACTTLAQCDPVCDADNQFCDSSRSTGGGICSDVQCGGQGQVCCGGNECGSGLLCASGKCEACGGFGEACCPYADNPANACDDGLQCGNNKCGAATFCGSSENKCEGATVCCNDADPSKRGQCVANNECNAPVLCTSPVCGSDQYCDASLLSGPHCKLCDADHCPLGKPNGMCDPRAPKPCENAGYICTGGSSNSLGTCTPCGQDGQTCCSQGSGCDGSKGLSCQSDNICKACGGLNEMCCTGTAPGTTACDAPLQCADSTSGQTCQSFPACGNSVCSPSNPLCCLDARTNAASCVANEAACNGVLSQCQPACTGFSFCNATQLPADCQLCSTLVGQSAQLDRLCPNYCNIYAAINCDSPVSGQNFYCPNDYNGGVCTMCGGEGQACCPSAPGRPGSVCETDNLFCSPTGVCAEKVACGSQVCTGAQLCCLTANGLGCAADSSACIGAPLQCPNNNCNNNPQAFCKISVGPPIEAACVDCASEPVGSQWFTAFCADHYCDNLPVSQNGHPTCNSQTETCDLNTHTCKLFGGECTRDTAGNALCKTKYANDNFTCALVNGTYTCEECGTDDYCKSHYGDNYFCFERGNLIAGDQYTHGVCVQFPQCQSSAECQRINSTYTCTAGLCAPAGAECRGYDRQCRQTPLPQKCVNFECIEQRCPSDFTCSNGLVCNATSGACVTPPCGGDGEACCATGDACHVGFACGADNTCSACGAFGQTCCPEILATGGNAGGSTGGSPLMSLLVKPGGGTTGTSSTTTPLVNSVCDAWMQCQTLTPGSPGVCTYPTLCGSSKTQCISGDVCCDVGTGYQCQGNLCPTPHECTPPCDYANGYYCDATGPSPVCKLAHPDLCGTDGGLCCAGQQCDIGLLCDSNSLECSACGVFGEKCCSFSSSDPSTACSAGLQCNSAPSGSLLPNQCTSATYCGSSQNKCTGGTICCADAGANQGTCTLAGACTLDKVCAGGCGLNQYCDATNLNVQPVCKNCDEGHCPMGGINELCVLNSTNACDQGLCIPDPKSAPFGICTACGFKDGPCCGGNSCSETGTICDTNNATYASGVGVCILDNRFCSNGNCVEVSFSQPQNCTGDVNSYFGCPAQNANNNKTGTSGFAAKSLINCDDSRCDDRELALHYHLQPNAPNYDILLNITFPHMRGAPLPLIPLATAVNSLNDQRSVFVSQQEGYQQILLVIPNRRWLDGSIYFKPNSTLNKVDLKINMSNGSAFSALNTFVRIIDGTPPNNPGPLDLPFKCNLLNLTALNGPRGLYVQSNCKEVNFVVDPFFTADAVKADFTGLSLNGCHGSDLTLTRFELANTSLPQPERIVNGCFDVRSPLGGTAIRYDPNKPTSTCKLSSLGSLEPKEADVNFIGKCDVGGADMFTIPIHIRKSIGISSSPIDVASLNYKTPMTGLPERPRSYYGIDNETVSPLKTVYVLDNRVYRANADVVKVGDYKKVGNTFTFQGSTVFRKSDEGGEGRASIFAWNAQAAPDLKAFMTPLASTSDPTKLSIQFKEIKDMSPCLQACGSNVLCILGCYIDNIRVAGTSLNSNIQGEAIKRTSAEATYGGSCGVSCHDDQVTCEENAKADCQRDAISCTESCDTASDCDPNDFTCLKTYRKQNPACYETCITTKTTCQENANAACQAGFVTCTAGCPVQSQDFDSVFLKYTLEEFKKTASNIAKRTAFRRAEVSSVYCTKTRDELNAHPADYADTEICRSQISDWQKQVTIEQWNKEACTFCFDQNAQKYGTPNGAADVDQCDSRCTEDPGCDLASTYCMDLSQGDSTQIPASCQGPLQRSNGQWYWDCRAANPSLLYTYQAPASQGDTVPPAFIPYSCDDPEGCFAPCLGKDVSKPFDYCGEDSRCQSCKPDGFIYTPAPPITTFNWTNTSELHEIAQTGVIGDPGAPYKYLFETASDDIQVNKPFQFSAVVQLDANQVFNLLPKLALQYGPDYSVDASAVTALPQCAVRIGLYQLQSKTVNGDVWQANENFAFILKPLNVVNNYPRSTVDGPQQEYCGTVPACNLFDPYATVITNPASYITPELKALFPNIAKNCFTWEYPIVPDYAGQTHIIKFPTGYKGSENTIWISVPSDWRNVGLQGVVSDSQSVTFVRNIDRASYIAYLTSLGEKSPAKLLSGYIARLGYGGKTYNKCGIGGKNERGAGFDIVLPYMISKYPDVFEFVQSDNSAWCRNADACGYAPCCSPGAKWQESFGTLNLCFDP